MTIVCTDGKVIAGDSAVGIIPSRTIVKGRQYGPVKIWKHEGSLYGAAGTTSTIWKFRLWVEKKGRKRDFNSGLRDEDAFDGIEVRPDGTCLYYADNVPPTPHIPPEAIGSGAYIAMPFLEAGFDPRYAVMQACKWESNCGPPMDYLLLDDIEETFTETFIEGFGKWALVSDYTKRIVSFLDESSSS